MFQHLHCQNESNKGWRCSFFKHHYITNPQITPETLVMKAAAELTSALKGTVSRDAETADALAKVSDLFHKIAAAKADRAKAKEQ